MKKLVKRRFTFTRRGRSDVYINFILSFPSSPILSPACHHFARAEG